MANNRDMVDRRAAIKLGAAAAGLTGLAGCSGGNDEARQTTTQDEIEETETDTSSETGGFNQVGPFEFVTASRSYDPNVFEEFKIAISQVRELGIDITIKEKPIAAWVDQLVAHDYKMFGLLWGGSTFRLDPNYFLNEAFHSSNAEKGTVNYAEYGNEEYDEIVEQSATTLDREQRKEYIYEAQKMWAEEVPMAIVHYGVSLSAANTQKFDNWTPFLGTNLYANATNMVNIEPKSDDRHCIWPSEAMDTMNYMGHDLGQSHRHLSYIYDSLLELGPDGQPKPWAATEYNIADNTTVDVTLREGMKWHDGEDVTPEDVKFTFDFLAEWEQPYVQNFYSPIESVELREGNVIRYNLKQPYAPFITISLPELPILPRHVWDGVAEREGIDHPSDWQNPDLTGSGPLIAESVAVDDKVVMEANKDHFSSPNIDKYTLQVYRAKSSAVADFEAGGVSFIEALSPGQFNRLKNADGRQVQSKENHSMDAIIMKCSEEPFNDVVLRRAVNHAVDPNHIGTVVWQGMTGETRATPIAPANSFWHNPNVKTYDGGLDGAKQVLKGAGYKWNDNGKLMKPKSRME